MALVACLECKKEISDQAESCPNCGFKISKSLQDSINTVNHETSSFSVLIMGVGCIAAFLLFMFIMFGIFTKSDSAVSFKSNQTPDEILSEEQDRQADLCKNGYASACQSERDLADLRAAAGGAQK